MTKSNLKIDLIFTQLYLLIIYILIAYYLYYDKPAVKESLQPVLQPIFNHNSNEYSFGTRAFMSIDTSLPNSLSFGRSLAA